MKWSIVKYIQHMTTCEFGGTVSCVNCYQQLVKYIVLEHSVYTQTKAS